MNKELFVSLWRNGDSYEMLRIYAEEEQGKTYSRMLHELGSWVGATSIAIDIVLAYYTTKFEIVKLMKDGKLIKIL